MALTDALPADPKDDSEFDAELRRQLALQEGTHEANRALWSAVVLMGEARRIESAIVADLAAIEPTSDPEGCPFCDAGWVQWAEEWPHDKEVDLRDPVNHEATCVWRRAKER